MKASFDLEINGTRKRRWNKSRLWFLLILSGVFGAGYFVVPKIINSVYKVEQSEAAAKKQIVKTIPIPNIEKARITAPQN